MPQNNASAEWRQTKTALMAVFFALASSTVASAQSPAHAMDADTSLLLSPLPVESAEDDGFNRIAGLTEQTPTQNQAAKPSEAASLPDAPGSATGLTQKKEKDCNPGPCSSGRVNWYMRFANGPQVKPLTPGEKGWLALRNVLDPFNAVTILGNAAISVGANAHGPDGPGMAGFGRNVGISYTEDITGEFFNTFLICSIAHQDPHYHRMPKASYKRRIFHAISQVVWTQGDNERGMLNYANLVGFAIDDEIANLYVPGRQTNASASAQRYAIGLATAPIDNFVTEFLPDVAKRIHVQVVIVQRIINQVANKENAGQ